VPISRTLRNARYPPKNGDLVRSGKGIWTPRRVSDRGSFVTSDEVVLLNVETEDLVVEIDPAGALAASLRSGLGDIREHRGIVIMTAVTVAGGTLLALLGPLLSEATAVGDAYVAMNSELLVLQDPNGEGQLSWGSRRQLVVRSGS